MATSIRANNDEPAFMESEGTDNYFRRMRGADPRLLTCRSKLQTLRKKLNTEINKQFLIRNGAENLYRATSDKKIQETVAVELKFVNSNIQVLKDQLSELNSSFQHYQSDSDGYLPMIPIGLKETKDIDFKESFQDFILEHYSENDIKYEYAIRSFGALRKAIKTPIRNLHGIKLLYQYYNLLEPIELRFFPPDRNMGIYFEWFDSLTGMPSIQKKVAFEKACVLFNIAALHTQIGAKQDRRTSEGVESAVDNFIQAASMFHYIKEHFSNAPCVDLKPDILEIIKDIMLAQARECLLEKTLQSDNFDASIYLEVAQEFSELARIYKKISQLITEDKTEHCFPEPWYKLIEIKCEHWYALAHDFVSISLLKLSESGMGIPRCIRKMLELIHIAEEDNPLCIEIRVPRNYEEARLLGMAHLKRSVLLHEECIRLHKLCNSLHSMRDLQKRLQTDYDDALERYTEQEEEDDFRDVLDPPKIQGSTKFQLSLTQPCFSRFKVKDIFLDLGPLTTFCAKRHWSAPRQVILKKQKDGSLGFCIQGESPVSIAIVDFDSPFRVNGLKAGDYIVSVNGVDTKWCKRNEFVSLIQRSGNEITLKVVTPVNTKTMCQHLSQSSNSISGCSSLRSRMPVIQKRRFSWDFSRFGNAKEKIKSCSSENIFTR